MQPLKFIFSPLRGKLSLLKTRISAKHLLDSVLKVSGPSTSLDSIRNPPTAKPVKLNNSYVPLSRRTLMRELLQDSSTILPSERNDFEKVAVYLDQKLENQFQLIQNELSILLQPIEQTTESHSSASGTSTNSEQLDREFWLIHRLADLAPLAGFTEISADKLHSICKLRKVGKDNLIAFVDPNDYDVLRFWIRGFHPNYQQLMTDNTDGGGGDVVATATAAVSDHGHLDSMKASDFMKWSSLKNKLSLDYAVEKLKNVFKTAKRSYLFEKKTNQFCFSKVFMIARLKNNRSLSDVKLFQTVPTSGFLQNSSFADNLLYLLPVVHTRPLSPLARNALLFSSGTAVACIGLLSPLAWLWQFETDLIFAWSMAATATAGASISLIWARYWRANTKFAYSLRQLHYESCQSSGSQSISLLLRLAYEEEFKAALLTYALLLRPSEAHSPISPMQLGVRAESWLANRISPKLHISLPTSTESLSANAPIPSADSFTGGSGPLFDLRFDTEHSLRLLRRLDLVHGSRSQPVVLRPSVLAAELIQSYNTDNGKSSSNMGLNRLWINDLLGYESDLGISSKK